MSQQLKFGDGSVLPITLSKGSDSTYPYQGGARDCIDFQITGDAIGFDALDALTASAANTGKLILITDDVADGKHIHVEAQLDNYTLRVEFGKTTVQTAPESSTTPATYEERMHVVLAQKTYGELVAERQAAATAAQADAIAELSILMAGGNA